MGSNCSRDANFLANLTEPKKKPRSGDVLGKNNTTDLRGEDRQPSAEKKEPTIQEGSAGNMAPTGPKGRSVFESQQIGSNDPPRWSQLKMTPEPPKIKIDQKKIMANLREKKAMCNDVALIGTGGKAQLNKLGKVASTGKVSSSNGTLPKTGLNDKECNKNNNSKT